MQSEGSGWGLIVSDGQARPLRGGDIDLKPS